jgi:F-type H+-transporting ATPase subunit epsilon
MARSFSLEIVTPEGVSFAGEVTGLKAPGAEGSFGVLANHHPMICSLGVGELKVVDKAGSERFMAITGGFFEVAGNKAIVLVDTAEWAEEIDLPRAEKSFQRARERLIAFTHGVDRDRARRAALRAKVRLGLGRKSKEGSSS